MRILVVDDYPNAAESLAKLLRFLHHEVRTAKDGQLGLEVAREFLPQAILLDISMPNVDGYEMAKQVRREPWGKGVFIVALTGYGSKEDKQRAREAGFDAHLLKPAHYSDLKALFASRPVPE